MNASDRVERNAVAAGLRSKMAEALAESWMKGEWRLVKNTIDCGMDEAMRRQWKDDTARALPKEERENFLTYVRV